MRALARRLAREQRGISLIELLLASTLMLIVLGATLATFTNFESDSARAATRNESQDAVRRNVGQLVKELRNLASPNAISPQALERAGPADLIFQTVDPDGPNPGLNAGNVRRVRYCLEAGAPARLWMQVQTWATVAPPLMPTATACPGSGSGWDADEDQVVAQGVTNQDRAVFTYDTADPAAITTVNVGLFVDMDPLRPPGETLLRSGAFLRNQNRAPTAVFAATPAAGGKLLLDGSGSSDPEGQPLTYAWMVQTSGGLPKQLGDGVICECPTNAVDFPELRLNSGTYTVWLEVRDPASLSGGSDKPVVIP
ncbi:MAG: hypothetical protein MSC31_09345 [Solirubrobacteraceae bacterium MAG38_C4-C5]|nr:hypothetical protein [Candidatus Siliceabacter maunaloa]